MRPPREPNGEPTRSAPQARSPRQPPTGTHSSLSRTGCPPHLGGGCTPPRRARAWAPGRLFLLLRQVGVLGPYRAAECCSVKDQPRVELKSGLVDPHGRPLAHKAHRPARRQRLAPKVKV